uniref:Uncharacterized protein n=1 Tax=Manihot esculenta TaxID=3983 RepID=A0A2C9UXB0_MANES
MGKGNINQVKGVYVSWYPPPKEWLKLNSDGSICWRNHTVSWGVLSRDLNNKLVHGFVVSWRMCSILQAEIWALWERVKLTRSLDIQRLYIKCNNILAMQMINGQIKANATRHVWRETNFSDSALAGSTHGFSRKVLFFSSNSEPGVRWLFHDNRGTQPTVPHLSSRSISSFFP